METNAPYDLLIAGGMALDPSQGLRAKRDVAIKDGKIAAVADGIPASKARRVVQASGRLMTPGLIDLHAHVYWKATNLGLEPDQVCGRTGVTTVVDAGSAGAATFAGFRHFVIERAKTRIIPFLHVSSIGLTTDKECRNLELVDVGMAVECVREHRDLIGGIKVRANRSGVGDQSVFPVYLARDVAEVTGLPLMVDTFSPPPSIEQVFPVMRPGDIATHVYKGHHGGLMGQWNTHIRPSALEAQARGVIFDLGHGHGSFSWEVAEAACKLGFFPDTLSTDLHVRSAQLPDCDMPSCMAKLMALGASLEDVVRWSTVNCAKALRREELGTLRVGCPGDVTVLELTEGSYTYYDVAQRPYAGRYRLKALFTVCRGVVTYDALMGESG